MLDLLLNQFTEPDDLRALGRALSLLHGHGITWEQAADIYKEAIEAGLLEFNRIGGLVLTEHGEETLAEMTARSLQDVH